MDALNYTMKEIILSRDKKKEGRKELSTYLILIFNVQYVIYLLSSLVFQLSAAWRTTYSLNIATDASNLTGINLPRSPVCVKNSRIII